MLISRQLPGALGTKAIRFGAGDDSLAAKVKAFQEGVGQAFKSNPKGQDTPLSRALNDYNQEIHDLTRGHSAGLTLKDLARDVVRAFYERLVAENIVMAPEGKDPAVIQAAVDEKVGGVIAKILRDRPAPYHC